MLRERDKQEKDGSESVRGGDGSTIHLFARSLCEGGTPPRNETQSKVLIGRRAKLLTYFPEKQNREMGIFIQIK